MQHILEDPSQLPPVGLVGKVIVGSEGCATGERGERGGVRERGREGNGERERVRERESLQPMLQQYHQQLGLFAHKLFLECLSLFDIQYCMQHKKVGFMYITERVYETMCVFRESCVLYRQKNNSRGCA